MSVASAPSSPPSPGALSGRRAAAWLRRRNDVWLAAAMGLIVALLMLSLPMEAALASSVVGAFVLLALVDTRVAVLALLLVRSSIDVTATVPLLSASGNADVNAAALMSFIAIGVGFAHIALGRTNVFRIPLAKPFLIFLLITFLGVAVAPDKNRALQDWIRSGGVFMMYILIVDLMRTAKDQRWVIKVILLSAVAPIAVGLQQFATGEGNTVTPGLVRIYGTFTHPSPFSFFLVQVLPLAFVFALYTRSKFARLLLLGMLPAGLFAVYEAQTRGAWVGLLVALAVFLSTRARWTLIFIPLIVGAMVFGVPSVRARFNEATSTQGSVLWRQEQWTNIIGIVSAPKLATVGAGLGAIDVTTGNLSHNEYLRLLVETGIAGLAATFVLYRDLFLLSRRAYRDAPTPYQRDIMLAFMMGFFARLVIAMTDNVIIYPVLEWYFWGFAAVVVGMSGEYERRRLSKQDDYVELAAPRAA